MNLLKQQINRHVPPAARPAMRPLVRAIGRAEEAADDVDAERPPGEPQPWCRSALSPPFCVSEATPALAHRAAEAKLRPRLKSLLVTGAAVVGVTAATMPSATGGTAKDYFVSARLTPRQEVPPPRASTDANGLLTGYLEGRLLTWRLSVNHLSGRAVAAHIHIAPRGKANPKPAVALCGPCRRANVGERLLGPGTLRALRAGNAYVNVHTKLNPKGEIRGQLVLTAAPDIRG